MLDVHVARSLLSVSDELQVHQYLLVQLCAVLRPLRRVGRLHVRRAAVEVHLRTDIFLMSLLLLLTSSLLSESHRLHALIAPTREMGGMDGAQRRPALARVLPVVADGCRREDGHRLVAVLKPRDARRLVHVVRPPGTEARGYGGYGWEPWALMGE